jgi:uncharacterized RDD family membrane protein YckC
MNYAGFWIRLVALVIDCIIIGPLNYYITSYIDEGSILQFLLPNSIWWVYTAGLTCSSLQGTVGKKILGLKVVDQNGSRISFARATRRFIASYLSALILGIGYLMAAFNPKKQALHDRIAGTYVINKD